MAASSVVSCFVSSTLTVLMFAVMQIYRQQLASTQYMTVAGGFIGSFIFILMLTAVSNFEASLFGSGFQTRLFPEVVVCLAGAMMASGLVHGVCVTTCFLFSMLALYNINKISQTLYAPMMTVTPAKKRK